MDLTGIEKLTKDFADARELLAERVRALNDELEQAKRAALRGIKTSVARTAEAEAALRAAIEKATELFERPKTVVFHGVKVGLQKAKGQITWDDEDAVIARIEKHYAGQADTLLIVTRRPSKAALANLPASDLKKLGVTVIEAGDTVIVKPTDTEVDRLVNALLKDAVEEAQS